MKEDIEKILIFIIMILVASVAAAVIFQTVSTLPYDDINKTSCDSKIEVTSICMEYAKAGRKDYNPVTEIYEFNNLSVHRNILLKSCNSTIKE